MHHYPFHPGDYMLDTAHLEPLHDLCYRRALDLYYTSEGPLADDKRTLSKRLRVAEQTLSEVLAEFFVLTENGWKHPRCDEEIRRYHAKSEAAKKAGSLGGKAKKALSLANAKQTLSERLANQEPRTKNQNHITPLAPQGVVAAAPVASKARGTMDDLKAYAVELGLLESDGEFMFNHWSANGWKNGNAPSKDWKAGMRKWKSARWMPSQRNQQDNRRTPKHPAYNAQTHTAGMSGDDIGLFTPDQR